MRSLLFLLLFCSTASAERHLELGLALGGHAFADDNELGVSDDADGPGPLSSALLGARLAVPFGARFAAEAEAVLIPTEGGMPGTEATVYGLRVHGRLDAATGRLRPFVVLGAGAHVLRSSSPQMSNDLELAYHWGAGLRYAVTPALEARFDVRELLVPDRTTDGATFDFEVTAGVTYRLGLGKRKAPRRTPPDVVAWEASLPALVASPNFDLQAPIPAEDSRSAPVIEELGGIEFEHDSAVIHIDSAPLLERAYALLHGEPRLAIEIAGHTSSDGDPSRNLELSHLRAAAVKRYLVRRGIEPARVHAVGHGDIAPVGDNRTAGGRRQNRRIEFRILRQTR